MSTRKLADLTSTSVSSGHVASLAENLIASITSTGEVFSAVTAGRTGCNKQRHKQGWKMASKIENNLGF